MKSIMDRLPRSRDTGWVSWWTPLVAIVLAFAPLVVDNYTLSSFARMIAVGLLGVSVALLTGVAGMATLGQVAPYAVGGYVTAKLAEAGYTVGPVQLLIAGGVAAAFSAVTGTAVVRTRGVVFLMVTLAVGELTATAAGQWKAVTGGSDGMARVPATQPFWGTDPLIDDGHIYWYALTVAVIVISITAVLLRGNAGTAIRGIRDNELRMRASGHRVNGYLLATYTGAGAIAGIGGSLFVTSQRYLSPSDVGFSVSALVLIAVVIGGAASVLGSVLGVVVVISIRDWAAGAIPGQGPLVLGVLFIACVYLLPDGFASIPGRVKAWLTRRREKAATT